MSVYGALVADAGLSDSHRLLVEPIPAGATVLDVGCSDGYLAAVLGERGCTVSGVEADPRAARAAREHCEDVWELDLDDVQARDVVPAGFDAVILGDVLEHLRDPWGALAWAASRLRPGGIAVVSVPNAVHWNARRQIARGRFLLEDFGTFDRTHLRWFTRATAAELLLSAGLLIEREAFTDAPLPGEAHLPAAAKGALGRVRRALVRRRPELFALQFVLTGRRVP